MRRELAEASKAAYEASRFPDTSKGTPMGNSQSAYGNSKAANLRGGGPSVTVHSDATGAAQGPMMREGPPRPLHNGVHNTQI